MSDQPLPERLIDDVETIKVFADERRLRILELMRQPTTVKADRGAKLPSGEPDYSKQFDLSKRRLHRGVHDGRYKFARYYAPDDFNTPETMEELR